MAVQTIFESNQPSPASLALVNGNIQEVIPEEGPLLDWHRKYGANHAVRLALDLDILKRTVDVSGKILEIGSVPLIFTQAAARTGYDIMGCDIAPERYANAIERNALKVIKCNVEQDALPFIDNFFEAFKDESDPEGLSHSRAARFARNARDVPRRSRVSVRVHREVLKV